VRTIVFLRTFQPSTGAIVKAGSNTSANQRFRHCNLELNNKIEKMEWITYWI